MGVYIYSYGYVHIYLYTHIFVTHPPKLSCKTDKTDDNVTISNTRTMNMPGMPQAPLFVKGRATSSGPAPLPYTTPTEKGEGGDKERRPPQHTAGGAHQATPAKPHTAEPPTQGGEGGSPDPPSRNPHPPSTADTPHNDRSRRPPTAPAAQHARKYRPTRTRPRAHDAARAHTAHAPQRAHRTQTHTHTHTTTTHTAQKRACKTHPGTYAKHDHQHLTSGSMDIDT